MIETYCFPEIRNNGRYGALLDDSDGFDTYAEAESWAKNRIEMLRKSNNDINYVFVIKKETY